jgi:hypothetical protein
MEVVRVIFGCCLRRRGGTSPVGESAPLLGGEGGGATAAEGRAPEEAGRTASLLRTPTYDAPALGAILDDFARALVPVDASSDDALLAPPARVPAAAGPVAPVRTLRSGTTSTALVPLWSATLPPPVSYSAAAKRATRPKTPASDSTAHTTAARLARTARTIPPVYHWPNDEPQQPHT